MMIQSKAPAKLILAGEHTVVQGHPAIVAAIEQYTVVTLQPTPFAAIHWEFEDLNYNYTQPISELPQIRKNLDQRYHDFLEQKISIDKVLQHSSELAQYLLSLFTEAITNKHGLHIHIKSDIPLGCGLGSSSALIIGLISAVDQYYHLQLSPDDYLQLGRQTEHLQHGKSSGVDLQAAYYGGYLLVQEQKILDRWMCQLPLYIVNTGVAEATTGACVQHTKNILHHSSLGNEIAELTQQLYQALQPQNIPLIKTTFAELHRRLAHLGIVPTKVQEFIHTLEQHGAAAKVCGAGSIQGSNAGIVCIISETDPSEICHQFNYACQKVTICSQGVSHD